MKHNISTKKLNRNSKQRKALFKSTTASLILNGEITTTEIKAKIVKRLIDKLITKAKKDTLQSRRLIHSFFNNKQVTSTLVDKIVPQLNNRTSGYTRLVRVGKRRGDNSMMTTIKFVDQIVTTETIDTTPAPSVTKKAKAETTKVTK